MKARLKAHHHPPNAPGKLPIRRNAARPRNVPKMQLNTAWGCGGRRSREKKIQHGQQQVCQEHPKIWRNDIIAVYNIDDIIVVSYIFVKSMSY